MRLPKSQRNKHSRTGRSGTTKARVLAVLLIPQDTKELSTPEKLAK
jgi:hypothetical protein